MNTANRMTTFNRRYSSEHSPKDVWDVINTPLQREKGELVHPGLIITYENLDEENQLQKGTRITYRPGEGLLSLVPEMFISFMPKDISLVVEEQSYTDMSRIDVLDSTKATGRVGRRVETSETGNGLLVIEAELAIEGTGHTLLERMAVEHGLDGSTRKTLEHLPQIIG